MPNKKSQSKSKNQRRIAAAENALNKVRPVPALTRRARKAKSLRRSSSVPALLSDPSRYIRSVLEDCLETGLHLPSTNYTGPYSTRTVRQRVQLSNANTANLHASLICNPYLLWTDSFMFEKAFSGADVTCTIPTCYINTTASTSAGLPTATAPLGGGGLSAITMQGALANGTSQRYTGWVRCHGVKFKIYYSGTFANRGGVLACITNPGHVALAMQYENGSASQQPASVLTTSGEIEDSPDLAQLVNIADQFEFVWRPSSLDFKHVDTFIALDGALNAVSSTGNPAAQDYLPSEANGASVAEKGWITGFNLSPAAGTQATLANYWCEIEATYDLHVTRAADATAGVASIPADTVSHQDPVQAAQIHNALAQLHHARIHSTHVPQRVNLGIVAKAESYGKQALKGAAAGLAEQAAARIAAMF